MSIVKTNKFQTLAGATMNMPIQVVKTSLGDNLGTTSNDSTNNYPSWVIGTNTTTWTDTTNLQLTITPRFATSIIKLELSIVAGNGGANAAPAIRIIRGSTIVWRPINNSVGPFSMLYSSGDIHGFPTVICFDSPNTTSAVTYSLQYRTYSGNTTVGIFGWPYANHYAPLNTFVATEIAQ